jgi:hypothetical protein
MRGVGCVITTHSAGVPLRAEPHGIKGFQHLPDRTKTTAAPSCLGLPPTRPQICTDWVPTMDRASKLGEWKEWATTGSAIISFVSLAVSVITGTIQALTGWFPAYRSYLSIISLALFLVAGGSFWYGCLYIYFKKERTTTGRINSPRLEVSSRYSPKARRLAFIGLIGIPIFFLSISGYLGGRYLKADSSGKVVLLVAEFDGPNRQAYKVTDQIVTTLRQATKHYKDITIRTTPQALSIHHEGEGIKRVALQHGADIVLWGWYSVPGDVVNLTAYYEILSDEDDEFVTRLWPFPPQPGSRKMAAS